MRKNNNKRNNQGFTLLELILTIILVALIFLTAQRIMNQLMHVRNNPSLAYANQTVRALIIDTIQNDWLLHGLTFTNPTNPFPVPVAGTPAQCAPLRPLPTSSVPSPQVPPCIVFIFQSFGRTATLAFSERALFYNSFEEIETTWRFVEARSYMGHNRANVATCNLIDAYHCFHRHQTPGGVGEYALLKIRIPIFNYLDNPNNNRDNNNINDDIVLTYFGRLRQYP